MVKVFGLIEERLRWAWTNARHGTIDQAADRALDGISM
jgi:hypothetical protein